MKRLILPAILGFSLNAGAQLYIDNATFFIETGAVVTVQGDITSNTSIQGPGKILLKGTALQNVNMNNGGAASNAYTIPNLEIDNTANIALTGNVRVGTSLLFTNGKVQLRNYDFTLGADGSYTGAATGKFAETNGTGSFKKEVTAAGNTILPVGIGTNYTPLQYQLTGGTYASAFVAARAVAGGHPNKHPRSTDYINSYWKLTSGGITGGTKAAVGTYAAFTGTEADIRSMYWNGTTWVIGTTQDVAANTVTAPVVPGTDELYGMNKFILVSPKVFLQGAFNTATGLMNDKLRNSGPYLPGTLPASNVIPITDPYRSAPYNTSAFTHVANSVPETLTSTAVLNDLANPNDQIVDWVFVELRNKTSNTTAPVVQTRSVLLERDGDLVDIDGVSPVYFKNMDAGANYVVSIRHRNHLGLSSNPASAVNLGLGSSIFDFTNTATTSSYFGTNNVNYTQGGSPAKILLWGGNVYLNNLSNYLGISTDRAQIITTMANPGNALTPVRNINSVADYQTYGIGDINFDRKVDYLGIGPDRAFLLSSVLASSPSNTRTQILPN